MFENLSVPKVLEFRAFMGQKQENGTILLGNRINYDQDDSALAHELCHFAELPIERIISKPNNNWDFTYGKYWEIGIHCGYEPQTDQATQREIRVWSYQLSLHKEYGLDSDSIELVRSMTWMNDSSIHRYKQGYKSEKEMIEETAKIVEKNSNALFSYKNFLKNYNERVEALKCI